MPVNAVAEGPIPGLESSKFNSGNRGVEKPAVNTKVINFLRENPALGISVLASPEGFKKFAAEHPPANDEYGPTKPLLATSGGERTDGFRIQGESSHPEDQKSDLEKALDKARHDLVDARRGMKGLYKSARLGIKELLNSDTGGDDLAEKNNNYNDLLQQYNKSLVEGLGDQVNDPRALEQTMRQATIGEWNKLKQEEVDQQEQRLAESRAPELMRKGYKLIVDKYSRLMTAGTNALAGEDAKWYKKMAASMAIGVGVNAVTLGFGGVAMRVGGGAVLAERINKGLNIRQENKVSESQEGAIKQGLQEVAGAEPDKAKDRALQWINDQSAATTDRYRSNKWAKARNLGISLAMATGFSVATRTGTQYLANTEIGHAVMEKTGEVASGALNVAQELVGISPAYAYTEGPLDPTGIPPFHGRSDLAPGDAPIHPDTTAEATKPITPEPAAPKADTSFLNKPFESDAKFPQALVLNTDHPATPAASQEGYADWGIRKAGEYWHQLADIGSDGANHHPPDQAPVHPNAAPPSEGVTHNVAVHHLGKDEHSLWKFFTDYAKSKDPSLTSHQLNNIAANAINRFTPDQLSHYFPHGVSHIQSGQEIPVDEHSFGNLIDHAKTGAPLEHHADAAHSLNHEPSHAGNKGGQGGAGVEHHKTPSHHNLEYPKEVQLKAVDLGVQTYGGVIDQLPEGQDKTEALRHLYYDMRPAEFMNQSHDQGSLLDHESQESHHLYAQMHEKFGDIAKPRPGETTYAWLQRMAALEVAGPSNHTTLSTEVPLPAHPDSTLPPGSTPVDESRGLPWPHNSSSELGPSGHEAQITQQQIDSYPSFNNISPAEQATIVQQSRDALRSFFPQGEVRSLAEQPITEVLKSDKGAALKSFIAQNNGIFGEAGNPISGDTPLQYTNRIIAYKNHVRI